MSDAILEYPHLSKVIHHIIDWSKINNDSVIVDAGASGGDTIRLFREKTDCLICGIEPDKELFVRLNGELGKCIYSNKALVGNSFGDEIELYNQSHQAGGRSIIKNLYQEKNVSEAGSIVKTLKIKDLFNEFNISKIDYLKLNIVGAEQQVIADMSQGIANAIEQMSVHIYYQQQDWNNDLIENVNNRLKNLGFETLRFYKGMVVYAYRGEK